MTHEVSVGSIVVAKRATVACFLGEIGVCYPIYESQGRPSYSFIFETGRHKDFSPDDVETVLTVTGRVCDAVASYKFTEIPRLKDDFRGGRFAAAFPQLQSRQIDKQANEVNTETVRPSMGYPEMSSLKMPSTEKH